MLGRTYEGEECSAARTLGLVGERWSLLILRDAMFRGSTRFSRFQKSLGVATNILAKRLEGFVEDGLMERRQQEGEQGEYALTAKGLEMKPVIVARAQGGDKWLSPGPVAFQHSADGQPVVLELRSVGDDTETDVADVVAERRQSARPSAPARKPRRKRDA